MWHAAPKFRLTGTGPAVKDIRLDFTAEDIIAIGRHPDNAVEINCPDLPSPDRLSVSRDHARLEFRRNRGWTLTNLSVNGSAIIANGTRRDLPAKGNSAAIEPGARISLSGCPLFDLAFEAIEAPVAEPATEATLRLAPASGPSVQIVFAGKTAAVHPLGPDPIPLPGTTATPLATIVNSPAGAAIHFHPERATVFRNLGPCPPGQPLADGDILTITELPGLTAVVLLPGDSPRSLRAALGGRTAVVAGSGPEATLRLAHPSVSRAHAAIETAAEGRLSIRDLGSTNGTFLDGARLAAPATLEPGQRLTLGSVDFVWDPLVCRLRDVSLRVRDKEILRRVCLPIAPNHFIGLMGRSGSGKSTLLSLLAGTRAPSSGIVEGAPPRRAVGLAEQIDVMPEGLTCGEILSAAARQFGIPEARAHSHALEIARRVQVDSLWNRVVREGPRDMVSGGQKKRLAVARELIRSPKLLLLDEPTTGQDPASAEELMQLFRGLTRHGAAVVASTHDIYNIDLFHQVAVLALGRLVYFGPPAGLAAHFGASVREIFKSLPHDDTQHDRAAAMEEAFRASPFHGLIGEEAI